PGHAGGGAERGGGREAEGGEGAAGEAAGHEWSSEVVGRGLWTPRPSSSSARRAARSWSARSRGRAPGTSTVRASEGAPGAASRRERSCTTRSARYSASSTSWVTTRTVVGSRSEERRVGNGRREE